LRNNILAHYVAEFVYFAGKTLGISLFTRCADELIVFAGGTTGKRSVRKQNLRNNILAHYVAEMFFSQAKL